MELIDSHCHLSELSPEELVGTLDRAHKTGVTTLIAIGAGYGFEDNRKTLDIANTHKNIFCALAMHPHDAKDVDENNFATLESWIRDNDKVRAVGEVGLDYHYMNSPEARQVKVLEDFTGLAKRVNKPLVIHDRDCGFECVDLLKNAGADRVGGVVHCFTGSEDLARRYLDLGFYVSFSGIITFKKAGDLRDVVKIVPEDSLLIETDSPFLAPVPHRGKKNEPAFVVHVAQAVAEIREISIEDLARITVKNTKTLFSL